MTPLNPTKALASIYPSFVDEFVASTTHVNSPPIFCKWAGIATVAGALERKVWVRTLGSNLYPNLYIVLVAPPGVGKTEATWRVRRIWSFLSTHHVARSSVTKASLIDDLNEATRIVLNKDYKDSFHSLLISSNELGVLIPNYESEFMNTLTDLYDGKSYSESRRTKKIKVEMERTNLNIIAACTPGYLRENIPVGAWDQGFLSRVILVWSGEKERKSLFTQEEEDHQLNRVLKTRLRAIGKLYGKMVFEKEAAEYVDEWQMMGGEPVPSHPRLINYCSRRTAHILKLSIVASIAESDSMVIGLKHIRQAMDWLFEAEAAMPEIFKAMSSGGDSSVINDLWNFVYSTYMKEDKTPVARNRVIHFLVSQVPAQQVPAILRAMEESGMIRATIVKGSGSAFIPVKPSY